MAYHSSGETSEKFVNKNDPSDGHLQRDVIYYTENCVSDYTPRGRVSTESDKPYQVTIGDRSEWAREPEFMKRGTTWYTDGLKEPVGTVAGIVGTRSIM